MFWCFCHSLPVCLVNIAVPGLDMPVSISGDWYRDRRGGAIYWLPPVSPRVCRKGVDVWCKGHAAALRLHVLLFLQNLRRTQKARRTTRRRALNSASEKTGRTTTTHQTLLNYLKWSTTAPMGRAQGASALHELLKLPQIEYKCELMKTGLFFYLTFFFVWC